MEIIDKINEKVQDALDWAVTNPEKAAIIGAVVGTTIGGTVKFIRQIMRNKKVWDERKLKDLYIYDRSMGVYHKLIRPLSPSEKIEIDNRRSRGERLLHILASMGVLD